MAWLKGFGQFIGDMFRHWVGKMTGLLSIGLAIAPLIFPDFFSGETGLLHNRWMWWLAAAASFVVASRAAWDQQREARLKAEGDLRAAKEELSDRVPRIKGEIVLGYLEIGRRYENQRLVLNETDCILTIYIRVVNHSSQEAWMVLPPTLDLAIAGRKYPSEYVIPFSNTLRIDDSELKGDPKVIDLFQFSLGGVPGVLQKPRRHSGFLMFILPGARSDLDGRAPLIGTVGITLHDTLGGTHTISNPSVEFRLNRIGPLDNAAYL